MKREENSKLFFVVHGSWCASTHTPQTAARGPASWDCCRCEMKGKQHCLCCARWLVCLVHRHSKSSSKVSSQLGLLLVFNEKKNNNFVMLYIIVGVFEFEWSCRAQLHLLLRPLHKHLVWCLPKFALCHKIRPLSLCMHCQCPHARVHRRTQALQSSHGCAP